MDGVPESRSTQGMRDTSTQAIVRPFDSKQMPATIPSPNPHPPDIRWTPVPCALCGADDPRPLLVDRVGLRGAVYDFHVVRCGACGFVYVTPRGSGAVFGNLAGGAARRDAAVANQPFYTKGMAELKRAGLPDGGRILDLGCARGDFLAFASERGYIATGVDLNPTLADEARARGFTVHTGDLRDVAGDLGADFDAVTLWDVIEHVDDPIAVLKACREVLRPGGLLFFHTGNARFQIPKARAQGWLRPGGGPFLIPYQHISHFDPTTARAVLTRAGFAPEAVFFAGTMRYRQRWKYLAMATLNTIGSIPARLGGPLLTNAMGAIGRKGTGNRAQESAGQAGSQGASGHKGEPDAGE
jgi:SAM-dependent methyltransferase